MSDEKSMKPFKNPEMVVLRNPVARAKFGLSLVQTKFLFEVLAFFKDNPDMRMARFYLRDYLHKLGVSTNNFKEYVRQIEDMRRRDINIPRGEGRVEQGLHFIGVSLFASAEYRLEENGDGFIEIEVSDKLKPYFLEITKGEFFYYHILNTRVLRSTYSIKLYLLLKSYRRFGKLEVEIGELREILEVKPDEYTQYKNFKARVLETARLEMLEKNDICFEYEDVRRSRKSPVEKIIFHIFDNPNAKEILERARNMFAKTEPTLFDIVLENESIETTYSIVEEPTAVIVNTEKIDKGNKKTIVPKAKSLQQEDNNETKRSILTLFKQFDRDAADEDIFNFIDSFDLEQVLDVLLYAHEQTAKGKTEVKNIYPYLVAGVRAGYGKGLAIKKREKLAKEAEKAQRKQEIAHTQSDLEEVILAYEKAKNEKIREITTSDPSVTDRAIEAVRVSFAKMNPSVLIMTVDDFRFNPMYREFVKKEIYDAHKAKFDLIDRLYLPEMKRLKSIIKGMDR